jgi:cell division protein ZapA (FtsZ GTPase activity inhibitor)
VRRVGPKRAKRQAAVAISQAALTQAAVSVLRMSFAEREQLADEIYLQQPNLLASVVVQHHMGASLPQTEDLLNILLVAYQAMKMSGHHWPVISEDDQDVCLQRLTGKIRFIEGLDDGVLQRAISQQIEQHSEPYLLAFILGELKKHDLLGIRTDVEKYLVLAALNLAECIATTVDTSDSHRSRG